MQDDDYSPIGGNLEENGWWQSRHRVREVFEYVLNDDTVKWGHEIKTAGHLFVHFRKEILECYVHMHMKMTQEKKINNVEKKGCAWQSQLSF